MILKILLIHNYYKIRGGEDNSFDSLVDIQLTTDGGYIAVGTKKTGIFPGNDDNAWVIKIDSQGNVEWDNIYGGALLDEANSVQQVGADYVFAGSTRSYGQGNNYEADMWVVKLNNSGNELWSQTYGFGDNDVAKAVQITNNNDILVAGHTVNGIYVQDPYVLKLDADGNHQ